jgi:2-acylglycerol O-acyltransferase 2
MEVRFESLTKFPGNALQVAATLAFTSYFFFWPIGVLIWLSLSPWCLDVFTWKALWSFSGLYTMQLFLYRPHLSKGWPHKWFLYGRMPDYILCYHDATCIREGPAPDPKRRYLFAMYPHGVYGVCRAFSGGVRCWRALFPGIFARWGSFSMAFLMPGIREFSLFSSCLDAQKKYLEKAIARGENIELLPGGIDEMNLTDGTSKETQLVMKDRKGFTKLAIENGLDIVPGFCFGEKWIHKTVKLPGIVQSFLRPLRMSGTMLKGRGLSFLGEKKPLAFVWGQPIQVKQQKPVEEAYLDEIHEQVMQSVQRIFDQYKARFGYSEDETLALVTVAESKQQVSKSRAKEKKSD